MSLTNSAKASLKTRTCEILEGLSADWPTRLVNVSLFAVILLNVVEFVVSTLPGLSQPMQDLLHWFEVVSVAVFTVEYVLRVWSITSDANFARPIAGRVRFALGPMALVDLAAILPSYLPMLVGFDGRILRVVRLLRIFRILKLGRYSTSLRTLFRVVHRKREELAMVTFTVFVVLVLASTLMYFAEQPAQPRLFSSIPAAMWWGVTTLTTVGYGDMYPITPWGKLLGSLIALIGLGLFALPAGILASGFVEELSREQTGTLVCPHCGKEIHAPDSKRAGG